MSKQPIEGLTVRIFDDPSTPETKGRRGYRQYTEQVGSTKIKHTTHNWDDTPKGTEQGLKKSTRDWDADTKSKQSQNKVQDLSLVSRSDDNEKQSLKNVTLQRALWDYIVKEVAKITDAYDKKAWDAIVDQLRKLREGVYASHWSQGNYMFAVEVYELSVDCAIKASRYEELAKCLSGLIDALYTMETVKNIPHRPYYIVLDILFNCCYVQNTMKANTRLPNLSVSTREGQFGHQFMRCFVRQNPIVFWRLYHNNPYPTFKLLMDCYAVTMRQKAIDVLRKSYLSTSIAWVGRWLGIYHDNGLVLAELERLIKPSCIKQVDYERQLVYFLKKITQ